MSNGAGGMTSSNVLNKNSSLTRSKRGARVVWRDPDTGSEFTGYVCDIRSSAVIAAVTNKLSSGREVGRAYYVVPFDCILRQLSDLEVNNGRR